MNSDICCRVQAIRCAFQLSTLLLCLMTVAPTDAQEPMQSTHVDNRVRNVVYDADEIYRLRGYVGYQIDLEFEPGEIFVGLGAGDVEAVGFAAQDNHLFVKPKASRVRTNLTVLTTRRVYQFDYAVTPPNASDGDRSEMVYTFRFVYPAPTAFRTATTDRTADAVLDRSNEKHPANRDYWYCGITALQPVAAFDDGVHTHLRFNPRAEVPAVFVRNDDGTESLLNFNMQEGELVIHRIARRFVIRRGKLVGCIVNKGFDGGGQALQSGTVMPEVERATRGRAP
ncbi:MAG: TrbG/VirB9 family P-type conjugative transfer protein [Steroidobacteraceae bacterium]